MTAHLRRLDPTNPKWTKEARGPAGRGLCRWCVREVPKGRRTFCGQDCIRDFCVAAGNHLGYVEERDNGLCARCGLDTAKLGRVLNGFRELVQMECRAASSSYGNGSILPRLDPNTWGHTAHVQHGRATLAALGWNGYADLMRSLWEADHIVPLAEGGTNTLGNLRTLCVPCHREVTRELRARMAKARREAKVAAKCEWMAVEP